MLSYGDRSCDTTKRETDESLSAGKWRIDDFIAGVRRYVSNNGHGVTQGVTIGVTKGATTGVTQGATTELNLLQFSHSMFCKNIAHLAVAREHHLSVARCDAP